jgi:hypothetical protein
MNLKEALIKSHRNQSFSEFAGIFKGRQPLNQTFLIPGF